MNFDVSVRMEGVACYFVNVYVLIRIFHAKLLLNRNIYYIQ